MNDLQARLDDLTRQATGGAEPPDPAAIARRGRARRRRQRAAGAALAALALALVVSVARGGLLPAPGPVAPAAGGNDAPAVRSLGPWAGRADATVLLAPDVSPARRAAIRARLEALPMVDTVWYESRDEALAAFRAQFRDAPDIVQG